jgi:hypothetical protein
MHGFPGPLPIPSPSATQILRKQARARERNLAHAKITDYTDHTDREPEPNISVVYHGTLFANGSQLNFFSGRSDSPLPQMAALAAGVVSSRYICGCRDR